MLAYHQRFAGAGPRLGGFRLGEDRGRGSRRGAAAPVAALDLGTNNCRLLIAVPGRGGALRILDSFSRIVRLVQSGLERSKR